MSAKHTPGSLDRVQTVMGRDPKTLRTNHSIAVDNFVEIGVGAFIVGPVHIASGAIIGAAARIDRDVGEGEVWIGNPARCVGRNRTHDEMIERQMRNFNLWSEGLR